ncbi:MAG TPA: AI-2E family transporter [Pyrinomonadaceae bacterium]|jgi:predicted PurR-regulated permease PerM
MGRREDRGRWLALWAATAAALYLCWLMLRPLAGVLAWAVVLVVVFQPVHRRVAARVRGASLAAVCTCALVVLVVLVPLGLIALALVRELTAAAQVAQQFVTAFLDPNTPLTGRAFNWLSRFVDLTPYRSTDFLQQRLAGLAGAIASRTWGFLGGITGVVVEMFFVVFTMYYLFRDGERIAAALPDVLPLEREQAQHIITRTKTVIAASVNGVLVIAAIQGALGGLAFFALGLHSALVWGVVMFFLSMIPMAGAFLVWVPAALFLLATGHWVKALLLVAWGLLVIGTVDNFLRPKLVGEQTKLHELFVFFSVLGGLQVFGVLGLVLGPVVLAVTLALLDVVRQTAPLGGGARAGPELLDEVATRADDRGRTGSHEAD